ncbi:MAG: alpha/beta superfamily hydrolase [Planctomycetota bacterium]|jgi:alpha/beta superfamily hydrolase
MTNKRILVLAIFSGALLQACLTPPAVMQGAFISAELAIELYPEGTERVEVEVGSSTMLRGFYVPAHEGAPVVLHLLEASGSAASLKYHYEPLIDQLQGLGFASLLVDYRGVGVSDGERSSENLVEDAKALWGEAMRRTNNDSSRIVLRGISLGTIGVAGLLAEGAKPGAIVLLAPIAGNTAANRFAEQAYGGFVAWIASALFEAVSDVSLPNQLAASRAPRVVVAGSGDFFLTDEERSELAQGAGEDAWVMPPVSHVRQTIDSHAIVKEELDLLMECFPSRPLDEVEIVAWLAELAESVGPDDAPNALAFFEVESVRHRFAKLGGMARNSSPVIAAALAASNEADLDCLRYLWALNERNFLAELTFKDKVDAVALEDPAGRMDIDAILLSGLAWDWSGRFGGFVVQNKIRAILRSVEAALVGEEILTSYTLRLPWDETTIASNPIDVIEPLRSSGVSEDEIVRIAIRTLLKGARITERTRHLPNGEFELEVYKKGIWQALDFDPDKHAGSFEFSIPGELGIHASSITDRKKNQLGFSVSL